MQISYEKNRIIVQVNFNFRRNGYSLPGLIKLKISMVKMSINDKNLRNSEMIRRKLYLQFKSKD